MRLILWFTAVLWVCNYLLWEPIQGYLGFQIFDALNALCISLTSYCLYKLRPEFITFFLLCASINNVFDEFTGQWDKLYISEIILLPFIFIYWYFKTKKNVRKI